MIKTFKVKHNKDFSDELRKAKVIAEFALCNHCKSSKDVKQFGLNSIISNQIIRKIIRNKKIKSVKHVNLIVPNQGIHFKNNQIYIPSLKLTLPFYINGFTKINQIELDDTYAFVSCNFLDMPQIEPSHFIGVDLNSTGHMVVAANPVSGKVWKLNKKSNHIRSKYRDIRKHFQKCKKYKVVKKIKNREQRICKDLDHKISTFLVKQAKALNVGIRMEDLSNIRNTAKTRTKKAKATLNSWSFYQFRQMMLYKTKLHGVKLEFIDPHYTSQADSRTKTLGVRSGKYFKSTQDVVEHADVNAAFNIALNQLNIVQLRRERDLRKRHKNINSLTDLPQEATSIKSLMPSEPHTL